MAKKRKMMSLSEETFERIRVGMLQKKIKDDSYNYDKYLSELLDLEDKLSQNQKQQNNKR